MDCQASTGGGNFQGMGDGEIEVPHLRHLIFSSKICEGCGYFLLHLQTSGSKIIVFCIIFSFHKTLNLPVCERLADKICN